MSMQVTRINNFHLPSFQEEREVPIWSVSKHQHSIIPSQLIDRAMAYYDRKGDTHVLDDYQRNTAHFHNVRTNRTEKQRNHQKSVLSDGQVVKVFTAKNKKKLRRKLVRKSEKPSGDRAVNEAYDGAKETYLMLKEIYKTNSINNDHFPLYSTVHYSRNYANAYWDGDEMVYGDGDGKIFNRFTIAIDIPAHEIAHGLTQERCGTAVSKDGQATGVDYEKEAGGINEALSDIFGIQVKQRYKGQTAEQSDWLIGEKLLKTNRGNKYALRSMSAPGTAFVDHRYLGTDSQVSLYPDYLARAEKEEVDPHDSSGIVNKAFSHAAVKVGGYTWDSVGRVYFETMPYFTFDETFKGMASKTIATAQSIFGKGSAEEGAVIEGWKVVQVIL